jgi:hypothetical protein
MKLILATIISTIAFTLNVKATLPVVDYAGNIQNEINAIQAYIKQGLQYVEEHTTALKEIQQVENEIVQLQRMGNPSSLMQLPGVSNIQTLAVIIQNFKTQVAQLETLVNPNTAITTANQVLQTYGQTAYNGFTAANGTKISPNVGMLQFSASNYNTLSAVQQNVQTLQQKKLTLSQQRDQAISALQSASDQSTIFKQSAIITALSAAIADVNASSNKRIKQRSKSPRRRICSNRPRRICKPWTGT